MPGWDLVLLSRIIETGSFQNLEEEEEEEEVEMRVCPDIDLVHMDDAQRPNRGFTFETVKFVQRKLEKARDMRKQARYPDKI